MIPTYRFIFPLVINNFYRPYETRASDITKTLVPEANVEINKASPKCTHMCKFLLKCTHTVCEKCDVGFKELSFLSYFSISLWRLD